MPTSCAARGRLGFAFVLASVCVVGVGCDPGHPFDDVQVKVFSSGDGRAAISVNAARPPASSGGDGFDVDEFLDALIGVLEIGQPTGPARIRPDEHSAGPAVDVDGVSRAELRVPVSEVLGVMTDFGFSDEATVFVSVCTSALTGRASGVGVDVVHRSSCAVWEPGPTQRGQPAVAVLRFADRNAPSHLIGLVAVIVAIAGAVAAALWARSTRPEIAGPDLSVAAVAAVISLVLAFVAWVQGISAGDSWSETGQDFDEQLRNGYRTVAFVALVGGVLCPAIVLVAGAVRRCRAKRP